MLAMIFILGAVGSASALSSYYSSFTSTYPSSATASFSCEICHVPAGPPNRNPYGAAYASAGHSFSAIEGQDSDGDGATNIAEINAGTNPGDPGSKPVPAPVACTGYTYSAWSACGTNGQQTRTVTANTPSGCTGTPSTPAVLTQACTPAPVACTGYTYSSWSACGTNGQQTRTVTANTPAGCTGTPSTAAVLTQACTPAPVACTGYTYSAWSVCGTNGQQIRSVTGNTPSGCSGTPSTAATLTQACTRLRHLHHQPTTDGTTLYMQNCSACHGTIERSQVRGESASEIKEAIDEVKDMSFLTFLTNDEIQSIADALVTTTPPPPPPPLPSGNVHPDGWLNKHGDYADRNGMSSCTACHGPNLQGGIGPSCYSCHVREGSDNHDVHNHNYNGDHNGDRNRNKR